MTNDDYDDFFRVAYPRLVAMGLAMSVERHVAQELAQEALLRAFRHREQLLTYESPLGWCRRVMSNLLIDEHRASSAARRVAERMATNLPGGDGSLDPAAVAAGGPSWNELMMALTVQQRAVATLFYAEDQSVDSIAEALDIATGTVKSTLAKVRANVRRALSGTSEGTPRP